MALQKGKKYLIDTNILIYAANSDDEFHARAEDLLLLFQDGIYEGFISTQNILEFKRVVTHSSFTKKIKVEDANKILDNWMQFLNVIYEDKSVWLEYLKLEKKLKPNGNRIFDTWLASTMIANNIKNILTMNVKDFKEIQEVNAINPLVF